MDDAEVMKIHGFDSIKPLVDSLWKEEEKKRVAMKDGERFIISKSGKILHTEATYDFDDKFGKPEGAQEMQESKPAIRLEREIVLN